MRHGRQRHVEPLEVGVAYREGVLLPEHGEWVACRNGGYGALS
jgi:hypothetical protein